jgi:hypothetical protein
LADVVTTINFDPIEKFIELIGEHAEIKRLSADVLHRFLIRYAHFTQSKSMVSIVKELIFTTEVLAR